MPELAGTIDRIINENLRLRPQRATEAGEHRYDGELDDLTGEALTLQAASARRALADLDRAETASAATTPALRVDADVLRNALAKDLFALDEEREPAVNPLWYSNLLGDAIHGLLARPFAPLEERLRSVASRLARLPGALEAARDNLEDPPDIHVRTAAGQLRGLTDLIVPLEQDLGEPAANAIAALRRFTAWLDELATVARGEWRLGEERFAKKLKLAHDDPDVTPGGLLARARDAHRRVRAEMDELAGRLHEEVESGCTHGPAGRVRCVLDALAKEHARPAELLAEARAVSEELDGWLRARRICPMPSAKEAPLVIDWLPKLAAGVSVAMLYPPGPLEPAGQPSYYWIMQLDELDELDAESFLREYNRHMLAVLSIHEALPGHYVQLAWSNRCRSRARTIYTSGTFVEGWAKYTERMVLEEGWLSDDPARWARVSLQQRKIHLRAVTNTILDVEMHCGGMDERAALELMMRESFQEEREARGKWDRARMTSTQLTTYFAGDEALWALRREAQAEKGFDLHGFHERILAHGSPAPRHVRRLAGIGS